MNPNPAAKMIAKLMWASCSKPEEQPPAAFLPDNARYNPWLETWMTRVVQEQR